MKAKLLFTALLCFAGCSLFGSPTATVRRFVEAAQKGEVETMTSLFSSKAIQRMGLDKIRSNSQTLVHRLKQASDSGESYRVENVQETSTPSGGKRVSFFYKSELNSRKVVVDLSKEGGAWKIDNIGGSEMEESVIPDTETAVASPVVQEPPPPPPPVSENGDTERKVETKGKTISGGVLNGKAISLPQPAYPPIGRAVKASGTVVVQVLVDENGSVVSATAVSGHPLLRASCIAAARGAKFSPTKLSGQPVKVSGTIIYKFDAPQ